MAANEHITISKSKVLPAGQDYYKLREEGIRLIQQLGSRLWTDYNIHDPGITILEVLCYALTDIAYRSAFDVKDLIAPAPPERLNTDDQAFFTAREILTTAPWTINDYRKALIDLDGVKNAWIRCSLCNCGPKLYVDCNASELSYKAPAPPENAKEHEVIPRGLYDVLVEFDADPRLGDLNSGKISSSVHLLVGAGQETIFFDVFFPSLEAFSAQHPNMVPVFMNDKTKVKAVAIEDLADKYGNLLTDDGKLRKALRKGIKATFNISLNNGANVALYNVPVKLVWLRDDVRAALKVTDIKTVLSDISRAGVASRYLDKIRMAGKVLASARQYLQRHRNITEDFCCIDEVEVKDVGVCLDMDIAPDADIEEILAKAYYLIGNYFNPAIKFYSLSEMLEVRPGTKRASTIDEIYDGPKLSHGFIDNADLEKTELNRTLYSSDIISLLMDIPGVKAVRNFVLVDFDEFGDIKSSASWQMEVPANTLPRLYLAGSKILVFKNGLPFLPDLYELMDTMQMLSGSENAPKLKDTDLDIAVPAGVYHSFNEYYPVQNSLPLVYGTGYEGLPSNASDERKIQAKQLKAYLLFFDQILANYVGQLSNLRSLFSVSNTVGKTYFPFWLKQAAGPDDDVQALISGLDELYDTLDETLLYQITESAGEFAARRNKFLDQLLARFSESFSEYALLLYSFKDNAAIDTDRLIRTKTAFLKQFPYQSAYRAQSFDYTAKTDVEIQKDQSGLHRRISALLGLQPSLNFFEYDIVRTADDKYTTELFLKDGSGNDLLKAVTSTGFSFSDRDELVKAINTHIAKLLRLVGDKTNYTVAPWNGKYRIDLGTPSLAYAEDFTSQAKANAAIGNIVEFAAAELHDERFMIVEHILLRPRNINDALLDICVESDCKFCGEEDPYSYKLTFIFDGEAEYATAAFRRFAEKTIRTELPAHVLCKICWVRREVYNSFESAYVNWLKGVYINPPADDKCKTALGVTNNALKNLVCEFGKLKSIYPPAKLHDCMDGNDENPVFLNQTNL